MSDHHMRTDWRLVSVRPTASLLQAMAVISDGRLGIALVVDENDHLLGTVTDGDMRRAILSHVTIDSPVNGVMEKNFATVSPETIPQEVLRVMRSRSIRQMPVCTNDGRIIGLYVIEDFIEPIRRPNWAVIIAGGKGRRMWPLTAYVPKPMLPVGNRPILEGMVVQLVRHGFQRIFVAIGHLGEQIVQHFGDGRHLGCEIEYLREQEPLGTGGALSLLPEKPEHPLLVTNGDLITDIDLSRLMDYHDSHEGSATVCVQEVSYRLPYGVVRFEGEDAIAIEEKPTFQEHVNTGIYVLDPELLALLPAGQPYSLPQLIHQARAHGLGVKAYHLHEDWMDVGHFDEYQRIRNTDANGSEEDTK